MFALVLLHSFVTGIGDRLRRDEEGATAVEYGLMVALIAVAIMATVLALGTELNRLFNLVVTQLQGITN